MATRGCAVTISVIPRQAAAGSYAGWDKGPLIRSGGFNAGGNPFPTGSPGSGMAPQLGHLSLESFLIGDGLGWQQLVSK